MILTKVGEVSPTQYAGYRAHTKARTTGATVVLVDGYEQGLESPDSDPNRWWTICDSHGYCIGHLRQADARGFMHHPEDWCLDCQDRFYESGASLSQG